MGKMFIKKDVLARPHCGFRGGLTTLRLAPTLVFCPLVSYPHAACQDKKAGAAHKVQLPLNKKLTLFSKMRKNALILRLSFHLFLGPTPNTIIYGEIEHRETPLFSVL